MRQQYEPSADRIIALYQQLEDEILSAVIRRILKMGYVSEASNISWKSYRLPAYCMMTLCS
ncbi:MAG: hypothetical protein ACLT3I_08460 [Ruminococcus sp.]